MTRPFYVFFGPLNPLTLYATEKIARRGVSDGELEIWGGPCYRSRGRRCGPRLASERRGGRWRIVAVLPDYTDTRGE